MRFPYVVFGTKLMVLVEMIAILTFIEARPLKFRVLETRQATI